MQRAEQCFRALNERILRLEEKQATLHISDEQVERVLRKILAERFSDVEEHRLHQSPTLRGDDDDDDDYFVEQKKDPTIIQSIALDPAMLAVDPESVPSVAYMETFQMLETRLSDFPRIDSRRNQSEDDEDSKMSFEVKTPKSMEGV